ncbi:MAG: hypothetical protein H6983_21695 [Ectothiorhodospiraceae bacterium]|nr:hypothetical protein [Chromatiales bacterium]MCP5156804.1 hypothetical protein [Ectothiorhodospiraceae bacterium]
MDRNRFRALVARCGVDSAPPVDGDALFDELERHYREPGRRYHTGEHIVHCLGMLDTVLHALDDPDAVELALWYHDAVYDLRAGDCENERRSAELFETRLGAAVGPERARRIRDLVMVTTHRREPRTRDEAFIVDIDLSSFGLPWDEFLRDSIAVREEFGHLGDDEFFPRQRQFLGRLLARGVFCYTDEFRQRHEERARANIERYLERITSVGAD